MISRQIQMVAVTASMLLGAHLADAKPGEGILAGNVTFNPYAAASVQHDSNVRAADANEEDDTSITGKLGLMLRITDPQLLKLKAEIWGLSERFSDLTEEDHVDFGNSLSLGLGDKDALHLALKQTYADTESLDYGTGIIEPRQVLSVDAGVLTPLDNKLGAKLGVMAGGTEYDSPTSFDWSEQAGVIQLAYDVSDKTALTMAGTGGTQSSDGLATDSDFYKATIGFRNRQTAKLSGEAGIGYHLYAYDSDVDGIHFFAKVQLQLTPRIALSISGENSVEPGSLSSEAENSKEVTDAQLGARWSITDSVSATLTGDFRHNSLVKQINGVDKESDILGATLRVDYTPPAGFVKLFVQAKVQEKDSTIDGNDFSQAMAEAGVRLQY
jgi:hypothetical protein